MNLQSIKSTKFQKLSETELKEIKAGWKFWGFEVIYKDQVMASVDGTSQTGEYGNVYRAGVNTGGAWHNTDSQPD